MASPHRAHRRPSFWLSQLGERSPRVPLQGVATADVCIVGGGFTGLWTAYELLRAEPGLRVIVLEAEHVGFGASGRNGGWVIGELSGTPEAWRRRGGEDAPRVMARAIQATVAEIGAAVTSEGIACDWVHGGSLLVAQNRIQAERLQEQLVREERWAGDAAMYRWLEAGELAERIAVDHAEGALFTEHCARIQPARLADGLASAVERLGALIHESSRVVGVTPGVARTASGRVEAPTVVLAIEGYAANLAGWRRTLLPLNSTMIVTEPISDAVWPALGWAGRETLSDGSHLYIYAQRTADDRIAIGGRGVPYRYGSRTDREGPVPAATVAALRERLGALFPAVHDVAVAHAWHGVFGVPRDWCPSVSLDRATGIAFAGGYGGEGVAASNLAARTLRDLILERDSELSRLPWVNSRARAWEPEPLRFIGARGIYRLYGQADRREARTGRTSRLALVADRIAGR